MQGAKGLAEKEELPVHILLVDDEEDILVTYTDVLRNWGYMVTPVATGAEAVELVRDQSFDLVITDLWMSEMDGIEVIKAVRQKKPGLPVVVITAYGSVKTAVQAMKEGAADYFVKPFSMETMRHRIGWILHGGGGSIPFPD